MERQEWDVFHRFKAEFAERLASPQFQRTLPPRPSRQLKVPIYRGKVSDAVLHDLETHDLAKLQLDEKIYFEPTTARLYMALLAKHLAALDSNDTLPGTNRQAFESDVFAPIHKGTRRPCANALFLGALPLPRAGVPLDDLLDFRYRRRDELLRFRRVLDDFQNRLAESESLEEARTEAVRFHESIELALSDLAATLKDARIETVTGSAKTLINVKSPALWGALAEASEVIKVSFSAAAGGIAFTGLIQLSTYWIDRSRERRRAYASSDFAYVYRGVGLGYIRHTHP